MFTCVWCTHFIFFYCPLDSKPIPLLNMAFSFLFGVLPCKEGTVKTPYCMCTHHSGARHFGINRAQRKQLLCDLVVTGNTFISLGDSWNIFLISLSNGNRLFGSQYQCDWKKVTFSISAREDKDLLWRTSGAVKARKSWLETFSSVNDMLPEGSSRRDQGEMINPRAAGSAVKNRKTR